MRCGRLLRFEEIRTKIKTGLRWYKLVWGSCIRALLTASLLHHHESFYFGVHGVEQKRGGDASPLLTLVVCLLPVAVHIEEHVRDRYHYQIKGEMTNG